MNCATPASPVSAKPAWNSKRCRPRRGIDRWTRPGSTSISPTAGSRMNTTEHGTRSTPTCSSPPQRGSDDETPSPTVAPVVRRPTSMTGQADRQLARSTGPTSQLLHPFWRPRCCATWTNSHVSLRPASVASAEGMLRQFAGSSCPRPRRHAAGRCRSSTHRGLQGLPRHRLGQNRPGATCRR